MHGLRKESGKIASSEGTLPWPQSSPRLERGVGEHNSTGIVANLGRSEPLPHALHDLRC